MTKTYTLTAAEAKQYDSSDDRDVHELRASLRARFGRVSGGDVPTTEVRHPDGYVIEHYTAE
jgi:hypothetical protein